MDVFADFLAGIENPQHRARMEEVFSWVSTKFPELEPVIKWNQPMFTDHGTIYHRLQCSETTYVRCA